MKSLFIGICLLSVIVLSGCSSIAPKSWGVASSSDAFKAVLFDPAGSASSAPELIAGGGCVSMLFMCPYGKDEIVPVGISYSKRLSMWGMFSGNNSGNISMLYISGSKETPEQTIKILEAFAKVVNPKK